MGGAFFLKLFPKICRKWVLFKARKRIQVSGYIHSKHILFFRVFLGHLKVIWRLFPEQLQTSGTYRTWGILRNLSIYPVKLYHIKIPDACKVLVYWKPWDIFRITWISTIQFTKNFQQPCHLRTRGIFRTLLNIYNGAFCSEPCVTLAYLKPWHVQNLRNI